MEILELIANTITFRSFTFGEARRIPEGTSKELTMRSGLRHKIYGTSIEEWIASVPGELPIDAVGLWQIVPAGREGFDLSGQDLIDFVRLNLLALLEKGAMPVVGAVDGVHFWTLVPYGETRDEMADAIIAEWIASGREPDVGGVWFALPHIYESKRSNSDTWPIPKTN